MKPLRRDIIAMEWYSLDQNNQHKLQREKKGEEDEDEYIDMEVNSSITHFFSPTKTITTPTLLSHHQTREFEFQMSSNNIETQPTTSPADELFYKGKLLPLHLPPRLQMVQKLLQDSSSMSHMDKFDEVYTTPLGTNPLTTPTSITPFASCPASPAESCYVSQELNHEESKGFQNKSWTKKLKSKIKSLFAIGKTKKNTFPCRRESSEARNERICHRRSFSNAFKHRSSTNKLSPSSSSGSSSSSSSNNSNGLQKMQVLKRNRSSKSETEASLIQGAIAHCKQSQHDFGFHLLSSNFAACNG